MSVIFYHGVPYSATDANKAFLEGQHTDGCYAIVPKNFWLRDTASPIPSATAALLSDKADIQQGCNFSIIQRNRRLFDFYRISVEILIFRSFFEARSQTSNFSASKIFDSNVTSFKIATNLMILSRERRDL